MLFIWFKNKFLEKLHPRGRNWYSFDIVLIYYDIGSYLTIVAIYLTMINFQQHQIDLSWIPFWWHQSKFEVTSWKQILPHRKGWFKQWKYLCLMDIEFLVFTVCVFQFRKFHENWAKYNKRNVEVWPWHSWSKILKLLEKLTQHFASVVLLWNEIPENFWEPCQTSMAVFLRKQLTR